MMKSRIAALLLALQGVEVDTEETRWAIDEEGTFGGIREVSAVAER